MYKQTTKQSKGVKQNILTPVLTIAVLCSSLNACSKKPPEVPELGDAAPLEQPDAEVSESEKKEKEKAEPPTSALQGYFEQLPWAAQSYTPQPGSPNDPDLDEYVELCGQGDAALHKVAAIAAQSQAELGLLPSSDELGFLIRKSGVGYVMPRLFAVTTTSDHLSQLQQSVLQWTEAYQARGELRCGAAIYRQPDAGFTVVLLQTDVLADVSPFPTSASSGDWLDLFIDLHPDVLGASVIMLPPRGLPHPLVTEVTDRRSKTRLNLNLSGTYRLQMMGTLEGGPRPILVIALTVDQVAPSAPKTEIIPGEDAFNPELSASESLLLMLNALRTDAGLPSLKRDKKLTLLARLHSRKMLQAKKIAHDLGDGNPDYRIALAGISSRASGENVARAQSIIGVHRVLYDSASHRENMLLRRWNYVGIAVEQATDGTFYATQLFVDD